MLRAEVRLKVTGALIKDDRALIIQLAAVVSNKVTGVAGEVMSRPVKVIHAIVISISVDLWRWNGIDTVLH